MVDGRNERKGNRVKVDILTSVPEGWRVIDGATNHPPGMRWIDNRKSRFGPDRKRALVPEGIAYEWRNNIRQGNS